MNMKLILLFKKATTESGFFVLLVDISLAS